MKSARACAGALLFVSLACAAALLLASYLEPAREWPAKELRSGGRAVAAALAAGEVHRYRLPLEKGSLLRLELDQRGIDVEVSLAGPSGRSVLEKIDRLIGDRGPELVLAVAERSGDHILEIRGFDDSGPGRYAARVVALRPASADDRKCAAAYRLFLGAVGRKSDEAREQMKQALAVWQELGEAALEAEGLEGIARYHANRGESQQAATLYAEVSSAFARAGDRRREAMARANTGHLLLNLWETAKTIVEFDLALPLARGEHDGPTEAQALHGRGQVYHRQGNVQAALDDYLGALDLWPPDDPNRARTLHQLGVLYARYLHDEAKGRQRLLEALGSWEPKHAEAKARTASQLGRLAYEQSGLDEAYGYFEQALRLQGADAPCDSAVVRARLALVEEARGARRAAREHGKEALRIVGSTACESGPTVHLLLAGLAEQQGEPATALAGYQRCRELFERLGDRMREAESLAGIARSQHSLGHLPAALAASRRALDIVEGVRPTVLSEDLRTSFFSGAREAFDFQVGLLLEMGAVEEAWATAEASRARVLRDLLAESGADLRQNAAAGPLKRERELLQELNVLESRRLRTWDAPADELQALRQEIGGLIADLEHQRGEMRRLSPQYAALLRPEPVTLAAVRKLLDSDTVLLEFHLGEKASTVWAVTRDTFTAARLPPRQTIEEVAREAATLMRSSDWQRDNPPVLCELSRILLAQVATSLARRRLVVVADGALETLSFAALPVPVDAAACARAPALMDAHEIVSLPSVAALLTQQRLLDGRRPAPGWLAVMANPAYASAQRRLPGSAREAKEITAGLPADKVFLATGANATRQAVIHGDLKGFRIVHFAVHGTLDPAQPLLSALALAESDAAGGPLQGTLRALDIYDLDLPAELVVLSACDTAGGREVPGEGLVSGLPRAFLYAGAARVLVSLWPVEDRSTHELMVHFYHGLFGQSLPPAQALQEAQRAMRKAGRAPYQWAGFVLLGDWRPLPPFVD